LKRSSPFTIHARSGKLQKYNFVKLQASWVFLTTEILTVICPCLAFRWQINSHTMKESVENGFSPLHRLNSRNCPFATQNQKKKLPQHILKQQKLNGYNYV